MTSDVPSTDDAGEQGAAPHRALPFALDLSSFDPSIRLVAEVGALHRQWQAAMDLRLREHGLSHVRWIILWRISEAATAPTQTEIARMVGMENSTLVRQLDTLEERGLIERVVDTDRRVRRIRLTPDAAEVIALVKDIAIRLSSEILAGVDAGAITDCTALLHVMRERLGDLEDNAS